MNVKNAIFFVFCTVFLLISGCVTRTITVKTNPSNALVYVDDKLVGESPVSVPFVYYGTRKITIEKKDADGKLTRERKVAYEKIKTPFYEIFPLDFVSELVWPFNIIDDHVLNYDLTEIKQLSRKEQQKIVLDNAQELKIRVDAPDFWMAWMYEEFLYRLKKLLEAIPTEETWRYKNKEALESVQRGSKESSEEKITKLNFDKL